MSQTIPIQVDGALVGAAVRQEDRVRFIATDFRVAEMDQTLRPRTQFGPPNRWSAPDFDPPSLED